MIEVLYIYIRSATADFCLMAQLQWSHHYYQEWFAVRTTGTPAQVASLPANAVA